MRKDATAKQIAEQTGLSLPTVWQILGNKGQRYSEKTRARVREAAQALGYMPNASARAISTGRFGAAALMLSTNVGNSYLPPLLLEGVYDALAARNMHMTLTKAPDEALATSGFVPKILREWMVDGLLINSSGEMPDSFLQSLRRYNLPSVWINALHETDCVNPDDFVAGRMAAEYLVHLRHRRIAYVTHQTDHYSDAEREKGYRQVMTEAGLEPWKIVCDITNFRESLFLPEWLASPNCWLRDSEAPTALVVYAEYIALPLLHAASLLGIRIPKDLSIVVIAPGRVSDTGFPITTVSLPEYEIGGAAVDMLMAKIEDPTHLLPRQHILPLLREGASCAPPP